MQNFIPIFFLKLHNYRCMWRRPAAGLITKIHFTYVMECTGRPIISAPFHSINQNSWKQTVKSPDNLHMF